MSKIIEAIVTDHIAPTEQAWYSNKKERNWSNLWIRVDKSIDKVIAENREEIIERAANKLVKSIRNSKAWKEKYGEIIEG